MLTWHQAYSFPFIAKTMLNKLFKKPPKLSNPRPNLSLGALERWQALYCMCLNAGWPTTTRVYLTKQKIRKVADGMTSFGSVN